MAHEDTDSGLFELAATISEETIKTLWGDAVARNGVTAIDLGMTLKAAPDAIQPGAATLVGEGDPGATMVDPDATVHDPGATLVEAPERKHSETVSSGSSVFSYKKDQTVTLRHSRLARFSEDGEDGRDGAGTADAPGDKTSAEGDFLVRRVLGQGGMGVIYVARQASLNRDVAVKMVIPGLEGKGNTREKFVAEALVTGDLAHPNIVPIYDLGQTDDDQLFYAMKVVNGTPWSSEIATLPERKNIEILLSVADAIAFAHDKGIIHRDLKPENVMLGDYGEVLVMDWGLAASVSEASSAETISSDNARAGTPAYMAPEMAMGDADAIGPASDIYLLGAILYEILTGKRPHTGPNIYVCLMAAAENFIQETERDDELVRVARRAMATRPEDRYGSVKAMQEALREVLSHAESVALAQNAAEALAAAERDESYEHYAEAIFAYREAVKLWNGNDPAARGEIDARRRYARAAFSRGDFDLAASNLEGLDDPESHALADSIARAKAEQDARKQRVRKLTVAAVVLVAAIVVILAGATIIISDRMAREREAREIATQQERIAREALVETERAREQERKTAAEREIAQQQALRAAEEREVAQRQALEAAEERERAQQEALAAVTREKIAQDERLAAIAREEEERRQREEAELARRALADEMARKGQLEDDSWWAFDADEARRMQEEAADRAGIPARRDVRFGDGVVAEFTLIPPGQFVMGSNPRDPMRQPDEYLHRVALTTPFYIGVREVGRAEWQAVVGVEREEDLMPPFHPEIADEGVTEASFREEQYALWGWRTRPVPEEEASLPAVSVSPLEIETLFLPAAQRHAPHGWRFALPTEAEWEYAARAGTSTQFFTGDADDDSFVIPGWTQENSDMNLRARGQLAANAWGLVDTHGNAAEIVSDRYAANYYLASPVENPYNDSAGALRSVRGGSLVHALRNSRSASRTSMHENNRYRQVGFRLAIKRGAGPAP